MYTFAEIKDNLGIWDDESIFVESSRLLQHELSLLLSAHEDALDSEIDDGGSDTQFFAHLHRSVALAQDIASLYGQYTLLVPEREPIVVAPCAIEDLPF